jgi:hypothetical protein
MPYLNQFPVLDLSTVEFDAINSAFRVARPFGGAHTPAISHVVRVIHSIPKFDSSRSMDRLTIYLGRSTLDNVGDRFNDHHINRGHDQGVILFRTKGAFVRNLEVLGIAVIDALRNRNMLCVANVDRSGFGPEPKPGNEACIYLTWGTTTRVQLQVPSMAALRDVAREVAARTGLFVKDVLEGLSTITAPRYGVLV